MNTGHMPGWIIPDPAELIRQIHSLHQEMEHVAVTSPPLGQRLVSELRAGTYQRLAPMVQALDESSLPPAPHPSDTAYATGQANPDARRSQGLMTDLAASNAHDCGPLGPSSRRKQALGWIRKQHGRIGRRRSEA